MKDDRLVGAALRAGVSFVAAAWRRTSWVLLPGIGVWSVALSPWRSAVWLWAGALAILIASAVLYKKAVRDGQSLGPLILRLGGVWLLTLAFLAILFSLLFVVLLASSYAVASAGAGFLGSDVRTWAPAIDTRGRILLAVVGVVVFAGLGWALTRVALASAATAANQGLQVLSSWPLTRRLGWRLLVARLLIAAPVAAMIVVAWRMAGPHTVFGAAAVLCLDVSAAAALVGLWLPLNIGLMSYIYQRRAADSLRPNTLDESLFAPRRRN